MHPAAGPIWGDSVGDKKLAWDRRSARERTGATKMNERLAGQIDTPRLSARDDNANISDEKKSYGRPSADKNIRRDCGLNSKKPQYSLIYYRRL